MIAAEVPLPSVTTVGSAAMASTTSRQSSDSSSNTEEKPPFRQLAAMPPLSPLQNTAAALNRNKHVVSTSNNEMHAASSIMTPFVDERKNSDELHDNKSTAFLWERNLQDRLFHRGKQEAMVLSSYESMLHEGSVASMLLVTGPIGTGKTRLVKHVLQTRVQQQGGYFLTGKFDLLQRPEPYRSFVLAFEEFTRQVEDRGAVEYMRHAIYEKVGKDESCSTLTSMIPALERILLQGNQRSNTAKADDAIQRFVFVFRLFLRAVCSLKHPVVLLVDDMHLADPCSLDLLCGIVADLRNCPGLFVVGTCDDTDLSSNSYLARKLRDMDKACDKPITNVAVGNLEQDEINFLIGSVFQLPRLSDAEDLGKIISDHTKGNLFYIVEFIRWLLDSDLLSFDSDTGSWLWDLEEIRMTIDVCTIDAFLKDRMERLPLDMRDALKVAASLGSTEGQLIEHVLGFPVELLLAEASKMGILVVEGARGKYSFAHDVLQKAAYNLIPESERELFHVEVGRRLWRKLKAEELDQHIFVLLSQMNIGKRLITREKERYSLASLCLHAGKKAAKSSTFRTAAVYLKLAIDLLRDRGWRDEYNLTLAVYNAAAEMELCTTQFEEMEKIAQCVLKNARTPGDKITARITQIYAMGVNDRQLDAIHLGVKVLASLGEKFPRRLCKHRLVQEMKFIKKLLKGKNDAQLLRLPQMKNPEKLACMQVLNVLYLNALLVKPKLAPFVGCKLMKLTLTYGLSMVAAPSFAVFGMACLTVSTQAGIDEAFRYGQVGLDLLKLYDSREYLPRTYAAFYGCTYSCKKPMRDSLPELELAYRTGLLTGDYEFACLNMNIYYFTAFQAGVPLREIEEKWSLHQEMMKSLRQESLHRMSWPCIQAIHHYLGLSPDPLSPRGDLFDSDEMLDYCIKKKLHNNVLGICVARMFVTFVFNDYEQAYSHAQISIKHLWTLPPNFEVVNYSFMAALIGLQMARKGKHVRKNIKQARRSLALVKGFTRTSPENYLDKMFLLEAEFAVVDRDEALAYEKFCCAIALARENKFLFNQALANERTARFFLSIDKEPEAARFLRESCACYSEWGAKAKVERLQAEINRLEEGMERDSQLKNIIRLKE